jgi:hypothetical protein
MKRILITILFLSSIKLSAQICFDYDAAGNRLKRYICFSALVQNDKEKLEAAYSELEKDRKRVIENSDFSELVVYPNPTASVFQFKNQQKWVGSLLEIISDENKVLLRIKISDEPIDVSYLPSGNYFIIISNESTSNASKLFITK